MHLRRMEFGDLDYFAAIIRAGSIAAAARELGISQPALSKCVRRLEVLAGASLLDRSAHGIAPTKLGELLYRKACGILSEMESTQRTMQELTGARTGHVAIGTAPSVIASLVPQLAEQVFQHRPGLRLRVVEGLLADLLVTLKNGKVDFIISSPSGTPELGELRTEKVASDLFVGCIARSHPAHDSSGVVRTDVLTTVPWVLAPHGSIQRTTLDRLFAAHGLEPPEPRLETSSIALSKILVSEYGYISFLPSGVIAPEERQGRLSRLQIPWLQWERELHLLTNEGRTCTPGALFVMETIRRLAASAFAQVDQSPY